MFCPNNQSTCTDFNQSSARVTWIKPNVTDNSGQTPNVKCSAEPGSEIGIGKTDIICRSSDSSENQATCAFTLQVKGKARKKP